MRMWMVDPSLLCKNHLLGEHYELHCIIGAIETNPEWVKRLIKHGYIEMDKIESRHRKLVRDGRFKDKTPLKFDYSKVSKQFPPGEVDREKSIRDLKQRCEHCKRRIEDANSLQTRI